MAENVEALLKEIRKKNTAKRRARMLSGGHTASGHGAERKKPEPKPAIKTLAIVHESLLKSLRNADTAMKAPKRSLVDLEEIATRVERCKK